MLPDNILLDAGFWLYCSEYADEFERHGGRFGAGAEISQCVDRPPSDKLLPIMRKYEAKLEKAWGKPLEVIFDMMGLENDEDRANGVYYTLMSCRGHGVSLHDDYSAAIERYEEMTEKTFDHAPFDTELTDLADLAYECLEKPDPEYAVYRKYGDQDVLVEGDFWTEEAAKEYIDNHFTVMNAAPYFVRIRDDD